MQLDMTRCACIADSQDGVGAGGDSADMLASGDFGVVADEVRNEGTRDRGEELK